MATVLPHRHGHLPAHPPVHHTSGGHRHAPPARKGHGRLVAAGLALAALAGAAWWFTADPTSDGLTPEERLVKQIQAAAAGSAPPTHTFGGELKAVYGDRGLSVEAKDVPSKACVSAAWRLAREGTVSVNGTTPMRISAAILTELCAEGEGGATIAWIPREETR